MLHSVKSAYYTARQIIQLGHKIIKTWAIHLSVASKTLVTGTHCVHMEATSSNYIPPEAKPMQANPCSMGYSVLLYVQRVQEK